MACWSAVRGFLKEVTWLFGPTLLVGTLLFGPLAVLERCEDAQLGLIAPTEFGNGPTAAAVLLELRRRIARRDRRDALTSLVALVATLSVTAASARWIAPSVVKN